MAALFGRQTSSHLRQSRLLRESDPDLHDTLALGRDYLNCKEVGGVVGITTEQFRLVG